MLKMRKSEERGLGYHGWLSSRHTFSFADYFDPQQMGFRSLRVINEDRIEGGSGFPTHGHRNMEILSYVVSGALEHKDSAGNTTVIWPGEVQRMSAGSGVAHSEYNHLNSQETHFFQIWILPDQNELPFSYGQKSFEKELAEKKLVLAASKTGREGSISVNQDADLYLSRLRAKDSLEFPLRPERGAWVQMVKGRVAINGVEVSAGDGLAASGESRLVIDAEEDSEFLIFDLA